MKLQTCRRHPSAGRFLATCSGCTQELYDTEVANRKAAAAALAAKVRAALGLRRRDVLDDETETRVSLWDIRDLNDVHARVGGTVTAQQVERILSDGTAYTVTEVTVTVDLPGVGAVEVFTDWDPDYEPNGLGLPVIVALGQASTVV